MEDGSTSRGDGDAPERFWRDVEYGKDCRADDGGVGHRYDAPVGAADRVEPTGGAPDQRGEGFPAMGALVGSVIHICSAAGSTAVRIAPCQPP